MEAKAMDRVQCFRFTHSIISVSLPTSFNN